MTVLSLFPGLGLLDMAFEAEGFTILCGPDRLWGGDVRTFHPPRHVFDGVIGGPPCQTFSSLANLVRARGFEPRFGNLIPEFERCVHEAAPRWFLMENVPAAPIPVVDGYAVHSFVMCNSWVAGEDGLGQEQERKRRFSFGVRGDAASDLRRWIRPAALLLPRVQAVVADPRAVPVALGGSGKPKRSRVGSVVAAGVDNSDEAKGRTNAVSTGGAGTPRDKERRRSRQPTVLGRLSGENRPERLRHRAVVADDVMAGAGRKPGRHRRSRAGFRPAEHAANRESGRRGERRSLAEMCRLQGLPEDFLDDAPWTADAKRKAVANGVPMWLGRAVAAAVRQAVAEMDAALPPGLILFDEPSTAVSMEVPS